MIATLRMTAPYDQIIVTKGIRVCASLQVLSDSAVVTVVDVRLAPSAYEAPSRRVKSENIV